MDSVVFTYGVLMYPAVVEALVGQVFPMEKAVLSGYHRYILQEGNARAVPAIRDKAGASVAGMLLSNVDEKTMSLFDLFEEIDQGIYLRQNVIVETADGKKVSAWTYVGGDEIAGKLVGTWEPEAFERDHLDAYVAALKKGAGREGA